MEGGKLDPATWPNSGIGRINPDGSEGSCSACHSRHKFSVEQARNPENCGKCHMGTDYPQLEIYQESKPDLDCRLGCLFVLGTLIECVPDAYALVSCTI